MYYLQKQRLIYQVYNSRFILITIHIHNNHNTHIQPGDAECGRTDGHIANVVSSLTLVLETAKTISVSTYAIIKHVLSSSYNM